ncbi:hypothetical protein niasHT_021360 [Heterodera trifolii]|uniref:Fibronectin type-III domain-containing protein n=1 Tax=Heterodera trifolii TaxID=157864 RepID=A0ABD2K6J1_9BILA
MVLFVSDKEIEIKMIVINVLYAFVLVSFISDQHRIAVTGDSNHVPSPPRNVNVVQINSSSIKVTWEPPADGDAQLLYGYNVYKFQIVNNQFVNSLHRSVAIVDKNKLYAFLNDLEPNTEYAIRIAAFNMKGDGELSALTKQSRILTGGKPPSPPRPQSISLINEFRPVRAKVEWLPPRHSYNLPLKKYVLWWRPTALDNYQRAEVGPMEQSFVLDNLYSGNEYELNIAAVNEAGTSENATEYLITPTGVPDGEPLNIRYTIFNNRLSILWDPPHWRHRNGNISHYEVELSKLGDHGEAPIRRNARMEKNEQVRATFVFSKDNQEEPELLERAEFFLDLARKDIKKWLEDNENKEGAKQCISELEKQKNFEEQDLRRIFGDPPARLQ